MIDQIAAALWYGIGVLVGSIIAYGAALLEMVARERYDEARRRIRHHIEQQKRGHA